MAILEGIEKRFLETINSWVKFQSFGIDISDLTLKYLKLDNSFSFESFGETEIPSGIVENGEIKDEPRLTDALKQWWAKNAKSIGSSYAVVALPEEKSFLRLIQLPKIKQNEIANAIKWEIEANIPLSSDELIYDFEIVTPQRQSDHVDIVISAFPRNIVESYVRVLKNAGIQPVAMELESQAVVRSILPFLSDGKGKIVVDIGRNRTSLIACAGSAILYTTTILFGGKVIEQNLMRELSISPEEAVSVKKDFGLDKKNYGGRIFSALVPSVSSLADELKRTIKYYQSHSSHTHDGARVVHEVLLVGGDANLYGLPTYLSSSLRIPVRLADPYETLKGRSENTSFPLTKNQSFAFATAIGLALRRF